VIAHSIFEAMIGSFYVDRIPLDVAFVMNWTGSLEQRTSEKGSRTLVILIITIWY